VGETLRQADWLFWLAGILLYAVSKFFAAMRLNIYFNNIGLLLSPITNLKLYWLGLFYNLFLPGSISGDAYKVVRLTKKFGIPYRKTTVAVILDRVTGLLGLFVVLAFYSILVLKNSLLITSIIGITVVSIILAYFIIKKWFPEFLLGFWRTFFLAMVVQLFANASTYMIILSLGLDQQVNTYMFIFLVASIAAVLPLTLGGLGAREIVFYELSAYFGLDAHASVLTGLLIYITVLVTSAFGLYYIFSDPLNSSKNNEPEPV
jgi:uncharacterized membrane protein YbhN (UPF0104 family)